MEPLDRRDEWLERRVGDPAEAAQRVGDLRLLRRGLGFVGQVLEAAPAAGGVVGARRVDSVCARLEHLRRERLGVVSLHLRHTRANPVAGQAATNEDDEAVQAGDTVPAVRQRIDGELELLILGDGRGHGRSVAVGRLHP